MQPPEFRRRPASSVAHPLSKAIQFVAVAFGTSARTVRQSPMQCNAVSPRQDRCRRLHIDSRHCRSGATPGSMRHARPDVVADVLTMSGRRSPTGDQTMTHVPDDFRNDDRSAQYTLIRDQNFGLLIHAGTGGLHVAHLPFVLDSGRGRLGHLRCHVARQNPIWHGLDGTGVLAVFTGPHTYISPDWYVNDGLVPTWNYAAVYVHGQARTMNDTALDHLLVDLVEQEEVRLVGKAPWAIDRVSVDLYATMRRAVIGIDIEITRLDGKSKMSQNRSAVDRAGVVAALEERNTPDASAVAALVAAAMQ